MPFIMKEKVIFKRFFCGDGSRYGYSYGHGKGGSGDGYGGGYGRGNDFGYSNFSGRGKEER